MVFHLVQQRLNAEKAFMDLTLNILSVSSVPNEMALTDLCVGLNPVVISCGKRNAIVVNIQKPTRPC